MTNIISIDCLWSRSKHDLSVGASPHFFTMREVGGDRAITGTFVCGVAYGVACGVACGCGIEVGDGCDGREHVEGDRACELEGELGRGSGV